uniref:Uncharacterized protein n=1 Tax=Panagrolaimus sp. ES5 TaxID=591445 RepID=A0AC34GNM4_9BILA
MCRNCDNNRHFSKSCGGGDCYCRGSSFIGRNQKPYDRDNNRRPPQKSQQQHQRQPKKSFDNKNWQNPLQQQYQQYQYQQQKPEPESISYGLIYRVSEDELKKVMKKNGNAWEINDADSFEKFSKKVLKALGKNVDELKSPAQEKTPPPKIVKKEPF